MVEIFYSRMLKFYYCYTEMHGATKMCHVATVVLTFGNESSVNTEDLNNS